MCPPHAQHGDHHASRGRWCLSGVAYRSVSDLCRRGERHREDDRREEQQDHTDGRWKAKPYTVGKDASFVTVSQVAGKKGKTTEKLTPIDTGLAGIKAGANVTVLTEKVEDADTVTSIKVSDGTVAVNKKNKKKKKNAQ